MTESKTIKIFTKTKDIQLKSISFVTKDPDKFTSYDTDMEVIADFMDVINIIINELLLIIQFEFNNKIVHEKIIPMSNIKYIESQIIEYKEKYERDLTRD